MEKYGHLNFLDNFHTMEISMAISWKSALPYHGKAKQASAIHFHSMEILEVTCEYVNSTKKSTDW
jgi:hypothetical protein